MKKNIDNLVGNVRRVDELGRVIIPAKIRQQLNLSVGSIVEFLLCENEIVIKKCFLKPQVFEKIWQVLCCFKTKNNFILLFDDNFELLFLKVNKNFDFLNLTLKAKQQKTILLNDKLKKEIGFLFCHVVPIFVKSEWYGHCVFFDNQKTFGYASALDCLQII